jgi:DASS family divalent anion:Na+ symporter
MTEDSRVADALVEEPVFAALPRQDVARFLSHVEERSLQPGDALTRRGEPASHTYMIVEGSFDVSGGDGNATIDKGFLGEEAAIGMKSYLADTAAQTAGRVLVLPRAAVGELAAHGPIRERMLASYSGRFTGEGAALAHEGAEKAARPAAREPLRVVVGWLIAIAAPVAIFTGLAGKGILPNLQSVYLLAILAVAVTMWIFRLLPDFVPALFAVLCIVLFGLAPPQIALGGFASNTLFMALSIFGLSVVITVSGLSYRVLLLLLRAGPAHKAWYNISLFLTGLILTPVVPTTNGRIAVLAPFTNDLLEAIGEKAAKLEGPRLTASVLGGASLMSSIFLSSKSVNFLIFGLLPLQEQSRFQWLYWFYAASVCGVVLLALYGLGVALLFRNESRPSVSRELVAAQLRVLGPMQVSEWAAVFGLVILLISFMTAAIHHIDIPWVALAILFSLLMFRFLSERDLRTRVDWTFLIFLASLIGLVSTMQAVQLDIWIADNLGWLKRVMTSNLPAFIGLLAAAIFVVRLALPINATVVIFATLLIPTAIAEFVNPWVIGFVILILSENFIWPYQASYYIQYVSMVRPEAGAEHPRLVLLHILEFFMKLAAIYASFPFWRALGIL